MNVPENVLREMLVKAYRRGVIEMGEAATGDGSKVLDPNPVADKIIKDWKEDI